MLLYLDNLIASFFYLITTSKIASNFFKLLVALGRFFYFTFVQSIKCFIPSGVLPRKSVKNEVVLITGSGSGLGRLMSIEFAKLGACVVLWDVNEIQNLKTKKIIDSKGLTSYAYTVDLSKREEIYKVANLVQKEVGDVYILINNAGIVSGKKIFDCSDALMEKTMAVNSNSLFWTAKAFVPKMIEKNYGHVVTIASLAGHAGVNGLVDYCASKHAAIGFMEALQSEIIALEKNIKFTTISPFFIDTGMFKGTKTSCKFLFPILEPNDVVEKIMEAVLTDAEVLLLPKMSYLYLVLKGLFPSKACREFVHFLGFHKTMDEFVGRDDN